MMKITGEIRSECLVCLSVFPVVHLPTWTSSTSFCFSIAVGGCAAAVVVAAAAAAVVVVVAAVAAARRRFERPLTIRWSGPVG